MGSGVSVQRTGTSMRTEIEKLRTRELDLKVGYSTDIDVIRVHLFRRGTPTTEINSYRRS